MNWSEELARLVIVAGLFNSSDPVSEGARYFDVRWHWNGRSCSISGRVRVTQL